jgi:hypothetical protein
MPTASFSLLPSPRSIVGSIAYTFLIGFLVHVLHKLTKTVLFSEFTRWNEIKRYHVIATVFGIGALISEILRKFGCSPISNREEQYPLECNIIVAVFDIPLLFGSNLVSVESVIFSYCRLYMILPGIYLHLLTKTRAGRTLCRKCYKYTLYSLGAILIITEVSSCITGDSSTVHQVGAPSA